MLIDIPAAQGLSPGQLSPMQLSPQPQATVVFTAPYLAQETGYLLLQEDLFEIIVGPADVNVSLVQDYSGGQPLWKINRQLYGDMCDGPWYIFNGSGVPQPVFVLEWWEDVVPLQPDAWHAKPAQKPCPIKFAAFVARIRERGCVQ